jgi:hypothetical protein
MKTNIAKFPPVAIVGAIARIHIVSASAGPGPKSVPRRKDTQPRTRAKITLFNRGLTDKKAAMLPKRAVLSPVEEWIESIDRNTKTER